MSLNMISKQKPKDFSPVVDVVSCLCENEDKILLLKRAGKTFPGQWGLPGGKVEPGESFAEAIRRELEEETGLAAEASDLVFIRSYYVRHFGKDFVYHVFRKKGQDAFRVVINPEEHVDFLWGTIDATDKLEVVYGGRFILKDIYDEK